MITINIGNEGVHLMLQESRTFRNIAIGAMHERFKEHELSEVIEQVRTDRNKTGKVQAIISLRKRYNGQPELIQAINKAAGFHDKTEANTMGLGGII